MNENSFFSIDRLVEFGLSVNVANQMVKMMNMSMQQMYVPGSDNKMNSIEPLYYALINDNQVGPFSECEVVRLLAENKISANTYMWRPGMLSWLQVSEMPDVLRLIALTPPEFKK